MRRGGTRDRHEPVHLSPARVGRRFQCGSAAKDALAAFINGKTLGANQLEFVSLIVDHLTEHGVMEPARLYESPFTDLNPRGPDGLFESADLDQLVRALEAVRETAVAD